VVCSTTKKPVNIVEVSQRFAASGLVVRQAKFTDLPAGLLLLRLRLLILVASVKDFPERLSYPLAASFADFARAFSGADADVLAGSRSAFAEILAGLARVQSSEITGCSGSALAQASRALGCAFADVLTAVAHLLARAGFLLILLRLVLLRLVLRPGLRLGRPLILRWIRGVRKGGRSRENGDAYRQKNRGEWEFSFHFLSPADGFS
jgi:hypothetical protein